MRALALVACALAVAGGAEVCGGDLGCAWDEACVAADPTACDGVRECRPRGRAGESCARDGCGGTRCGRDLACVCSTYGACRCEEPTTCVVDIDCANEQYYCVTRQSASAETVCGAPVCTRYGVDGEVCGSTTERSRSGCGMLQCGPSLFCSGNRATLGVCQSLQKQRSCTGNGDCEAWEACQSVKVDTLGCGSFCLPRLAQGEVCSTSACGRRECMVGLKCDESTWTCEALRSCQTDVQCSSGEACQEVVDPSQGMTCTDTRVCKPPARLGEACRERTAGVRACEVQQCASGLICEHDANTGHGVCEAGRSRPGSGKFCLSDNACEWTEYCRHSDTSCTAGSCVAKLGKGEKCELVPACSLEEHVCLPGLECKRTPGTNLAQCAQLVPCSPDDASACPVGYACHLRSDATDRDACAADTPDAYACHPRAGDRDWCRNLPCGPVCAQGLRCSILSEKCISDAVSTPVPSPTATPSGSASSSLIGQCPPFYLYERETELTCVINVTQPVIITEIKLMVYNDALLCNTASPIIEVGPQATITGSRVSRQWYDIKLTEPLLYYPVGWDVPMAQRQPVNIYVTNQNALCDLEGAPWEVYFEELNVSTTDPTSPTPVPATAPPQTSAPQTGAPPTSPPNTTVPTTLPPRTPVPQTPAATSAPSTDMPPTLLPTTAVPQTPQPMTLDPIPTPPPTPTPATETPATPMPATDAPPTFAPVTGAPVTPLPVPGAPPTPQPVTQAPQTSQPVTPQVPTMAPPTNVPTSAPSNTCSTNADCAAGAGCVVRAGLDDGSCLTDRECTTNLVEGEVCKVGQRCGARCGGGLQCKAESYGALRGTCRAVDQLVQVCHTDADCAEEEVCWQAVDEQAGTTSCAVYKTCRARVVEGGACGGEGLPLCVRGVCAEDLACVNDVCGSRAECSGDGECGVGEACLPRVDGDACSAERVCVEPLGRGEACPLQTPVLCRRPCSEGLSCTPRPGARDTVYGTCETPLPTSECNDDHGCAAGEHCTPAVNTDALGGFGTCLAHNVCKERAAEGEKCMLSASTPCLSTLCQEGSSCVVPRGETSGVCRALSRCSASSACPEATSCLPLVDVANPTVCAAARVCVPHGTAGELCGTTDDPALACFARTCGLGLVCVESDTHATCQPEDIVNGRPCATDLDCPLDQSCVADIATDNVTCVEQKRCRPRVGAGGVCGSGTAPCHVPRCEEGLTCVEEGLAQDRWVCTPLTRCNASHGDLDCLPEEACMAAVDPAERAICLPGISVCTPKADLGERCGSGASCHFRQCKMGLRCRTSPDVTRGYGICVSDSDGDVRCATDLDCNGPEVCALKAKGIPDPQNPCFPYRVCTRRATVGERCIADGLPDCLARPCAMGLLCTPSKTTAGLSLCTEPKRCEHQDDCDTSELCVLATSYDADSDEHPCLTYKVCQPQAQEGDACDGFGLQPQCKVRSCLAPLTCVHPRGDEELGVCMNTERKPCDAAADCSNDETCAPAADVDDKGKCLDHKVCIPKAAEGQPCGPNAFACSFQYCKGGLTCTYNETGGESVGTCVPEKEPEPCVSAADCDVMQMCMPARREGAADGETLCISNSSVCAPRAREGEACAGHLTANPCILRRCAPGLRCEISPENVLMPDATGVCVSERTAQRCTSDDQCRGDEFCKVSSEEHDPWTCLPYSVCTPRSREGDGCGWEDSRCMTRVCGAGLKCERVQGQASGKCVPSLCATNADCAAGDACLPRCGLPQTVCKPRVGEGARCGGLRVAMCDVQVCQEGLYCYYPPGQSQQPGYCVSDETAFCRTGDTKRVDSCNLCTCEALDPTALPAMTDGVWRCTDVKCKYNCFTKDDWPAAKKEWCCANVGLGCYDCDWSSTTRLPWSREQEEWCCAREGVRCPTTKAVASRASCEQSPYTECCWRYGYGCTRDVYDCFTPDPVQSQYEQNWCCSERDDCGYDCNKYTVGGAAKEVQDMCCEDRGVCAGGWFQRTASVEGRPVLPEPVSALLKVALMVQWPAADLLRNPMFVVRKIRRAMLAVGRGRLRPNDVVLERVGIFMADGKLPHAAIAEDWIVEIPSAVNERLAVIEEQPIFQDIVGSVSKDPNYALPVSRSVYEPSARFEVWVEAQLTSPASRAVLDDIAADLAQTHRAEDTTSEYFLPFKAMALPDRAGEQSGAADDGEDEDPSHSRPLVIAGCSAFAALCLGGMVVLLLRKPKRTAAPADESGSKLLHDTHNGRPVNAGSSAALTVPLSYSDHEVPEDKLMDEMALEMRQVNSEGGSSIDGDTSLSSM